MITDRQPKLWRLDCRRRSPSLASTKQPLFQSPEHFVQSECNLTKRSLNSIRTKRTSQALVRRAANVFVDTVHLETVGTNECVYPSASLCATSRSLHQPWKINIAACTRQVHVARASTTLHSFLAGRNYPFLCKANKQSPNKRATQTDRSPPPSGGLNIFCRTIVVLRRRTQTLWNFLSSQDAPILFDFRGEF